MFTFRYNLARSLLILGLRIMPDSLYRRLLILRLRELAEEMLTLAKEAKNGNK